MNREEVLMKKSVSEFSVASDSSNKNYTIPRTYGVYEVRTSNTKRYRFGNHPVRETELFREFADVKRITLFLARDEAKELANLLNS